MSRYHRVWVVYRKELVDTLRDKRTLIAMILVPIVLYPVLMVVLVEALRVETGRRQTEHYSICVPTERHRLWLQDVLRREEAQTQAEEQEQKEAAKELGEEAAEGDAGLHAHLRAEQVTIVAAAAGQSLWELVSSQKCHLGVLVEPSPDPDRPADATNRVVQLIYCDTDPRSDFVFNQMARILGNEAERIVRSRLSKYPQGDAILTPLMSSSVSTAGPDQQFAKILAMIVPFLLVTMTVTGAMYPAIDLTAGERERGTLETLAAAPVPVGQIVAGKFGVIVTIAMISTALNLASMTAMVHFSRLDRLASWPMQSSRKMQMQAAPTTAPATSAASTNAAVMESGGPPGAKLAFSQRDYIEQRIRLEQEARERIGFLKTAAPVILLAMIPFAVFFGGVMLAACSFARSFKEAQNYMMPVMIAAIIPAMVVSYMPTVNLQGVMMVAPVANVVILMRELFLGRCDVPAMIITLLSTCLYAAAAVAIAAKVYGHEAVLFGDVGSYKTLLRRRFFKPLAFPSPALALLTVALIFPVNFYWQSYQAGADLNGEKFRSLMIVAQLLIFAAPVLLLAWYRRLHLGQTFSLRMPNRRHVAAALLLAVSVAPVSQLLQQIQYACFPPSPATERLLQRQLELMGGGSLLVMLLVFAVLPSICEELVFRGFLLAGLRQAFSPAAVLLIVGVIFGLFHVNVEKIPIVSLLGILLAFLCLRSGSIYPAMLVHLANNGLGLWLARDAEGSALRRFFGVVEQEAASPSVHFDARAAAFVVIFLIGLAILGLTAVRQSHPASQRSGPG